MVIPDQLRRSVAFICYRDKLQVIRFAGTCFFFGLVPDGHSVDGSQGFFNYIITAKHVIAAIKSKSIDGKVILRINRKNADVAYVDTDANDWFSNPDDPTDVAILDWMPDPDSDFEISRIMSDMIQKDKVEPIEKVWPGDDVFIVGLFVNHAGRKRNTPIVRAGNIAMLADENEKIRTKHFSDMDAHLIESRSIGGLSGSPVYIHMTTPRIDDSGHAMFGNMRYIYLFGLIHGHYDVALPDEDNVVDDELKEEIVNMGIAIVVPVKKIKETLNHPLLVKAREDELNEIHELNAPTEDSIEETELTRDEEDHPTPKSQ